MTSNPWENVQLALSLLYITILTYGGCARALESYLWFLGGQGEQGYSIIYVCMSLYMWSHAMVDYFIL